MDVKISVIVSTYNRRKKLEKAIKSILKQTFQDYEIIIVDDVSTDDTEQYCRKLEKKYEGVIRYIKLKEHWGRHGRPKNVGIKEAKSSLIAYLDDDNEYLMDHLQALYNDLMRTGADFVYGDRWVINEEEKNKKAKGISSDLNTNLLKTRNYIDTSDFLCKKEVLLKVGGWDEYLPKFADWNLFVRLSKLNLKFFHVKKILTNYYIHKKMNQLQHKSPVNPQTGDIMPTFEPDTVVIYARQDTLEPEKPLKIAIFTLTYDRLEYTKLTLNSLRENAGYPYDHFIVDNGSTDGTAQWLMDNKTQYNIKGLILNKENVGISKASNQALDRMKTVDKYDIIIKLDNDCLLETKNILLDIMELFRRNKRLAVSPNIEGLIDNAGGMPRFTNGYIGQSLFGFVEHIGGIFLAVDAGIYDNFRWKEDDFLHGMQDYIFSQYCLKQGIALVYYENHRAMHIDSTYGQKKKFPDYFERRKKEKITKYKI